MQESYAFTQSVLEPQVSQMRASDAFMRTAVEGSVEGFSAVCAQYAHGARELRYELGRAGHRGMHGGVGAWNRGDRGVLALAWSMGAMQPRLESSRIASSPTRSPIRHISVVRALPHSMAGNVSPSPPVIWSRPGRCRWSNFR
jgi:hypothetical protein